MTDTAEKDWYGQGAEFKQLLQNLFEAADEQELRERINGNRMAFTYPFIEYRIWAADTIRKQYTALTGMDKALRTPTETDELRLCQKQLTRLKAIERCLHDLKAEGYQKETGQIASEQPSVLPGPAPAPALDKRLVGAWEYSTYSATGGLSISHVETLGLYPDGHFRFRSDTYSNMTHRNMYGDETGRTSADADSPDERGRWQADGETLRLDRSSGAYAVYNYEVDAEGMFWTPLEPNRKPTFWKRLTRY